jgi:hypothetical protein
LVGRDKFDAHTELWRRPSPSLPSSDALDPPLTSLHHLLHLPSTGASPLDQSMPCRGMTCHSHAITISGHLWPAPPCPFSPSHSVDHDQTLPRRKITSQHIEINTPRRAQACPCTRQCAHGERPGRARARCASSPQPVPRHQLLHDDSPQHQDPARRCLELSHALSPSRRTTTSATVPHRRVTLATMLDHQTLFRAHRDVP